MLIVDGTTASYVVSYSGLKATMTAAHVHAPADATGFAGVMFPLTVVPPSTTSGLFIGTQTGLSVANIADIEAGRAYFNIHSASPDGFPGGEIRGQLVAP